MLLSRPQYCLFRWALTWASRTVIVAYILEVLAAMLYPRHICMLKGVLFSLFTSSVRLISGVFNIISSAVQISGLEYCLLSNALICAFVLSPKGSCYLVLKNSHCSINPRVFAALLYPQHIWMLKGVLFSFFTSSLKAHISVYNIVSSAVLIPGP